MCVASQDILWDVNLVPTEQYSGSTSLALPKLNLQFLTLHDYLLRNFTLYRLESTYEIRQDLTKAVRLLQPRTASDTKKTLFTGWARYAVPLRGFSVTKVKKPDIGQMKPATVRVSACCCYCWPPLLFLLVV